MARYDKKLVRDNIPEIIKKDGGKPILRKLRKREFQAALKHKLVEEVSECVNAHTREELVNELADIQEVMTAIYDAFDIACSDVTNAARKKRKVRGGFSKRLFLERIN